MVEDPQDRTERLAEEARGWIVRMASGAMERDELDRFKAWRAADPDHDRTFEDQRRLWRASGPVMVTPSRLPPRRRSRRGSLGTVVGRRRASFGIAAGVAAAVAAFAVSPEIDLMLRADHRADVAVRSVVLPDGSTALLDAGSAIAVRYDEGERRVELLRGDAWFEVAHGDRRPFRVAALGGVTQDVGTAFEVRREDEAVTVAVTQGAVRVGARETGDGELLRASQRARYRDGGSVARLSNLSVGEIAAWRTGELLFDNIGVRDAIARIGRYRHGPVIVLGNVADDRRISGVFRTDRSDEAIDAVATMSGLAVYRFAGVTLLRPAR